MDNLDSQQALEIFCGNGVIERAYGEECDDGGKINGDGCSRACQVEAGWQCRFIRQ